MDTRCYSCGRIAAGRMHVGKLSDLYVICALTSVASASLLTHSMAALGSFSKLHNRQSKAGV